MNWADGQTKNHYFLETSTAVFGSYTSDRNRWNISPGQMQHGLEDVGAIFGASFTEQSVVCLVGKDRKSIIHNQSVYFTANPR